MNNDDKGSPSRRLMVVGAVAANVAAAAAITAFAQPPALLRRSPCPIPRCPTPPRSIPNRRSSGSPSPGRASRARLDPKPDHGETSYRGSGRLAGRKALITGGDSGMGRAAAIAYAREGADVAINYFPTEEPDAQEVIALIRAEKRIGLAIPGDLRDAAFCRKLVANAVQGLGGLDIVVSNAGRQQTQASILDITDEEFDHTMKTNIYAPF
jgi:hypothetical protein